MSIKPKKNYTIKCSLYIVRGTKNFIAYFAMVKAGVMGINCDEQYYMEISETNDKLCPGAGLKISASESS